MSAIQLSPLESLPPAPLPRTRISSSRSSHKNKNENISSSPIDFSSSPVQRRNRKGDRRAKIDDIEFDGEESDKQDCKTGDSNDSSELRPSLERAETKTMRRSSSEGDLSPVLTSLYGENSKDNDVVDNRKAVSDPSDR